MTRQKVDVIPASVRSVQNGGQLKSQTNIRVAAYCRVSTGDESQQTSYTTQKAFYKDLITRKPGWIFAGIYADEAKSGTNREHREEFNRMIKDAMDGKLDYIVTKSISRFARNTIDSLTCTRELRQLKPPVGIYFEKENIDTLDAKGELILTILSALAQDESRSMSDEEKEAANKRCPSERYHECALEQSFMELLYSMKRDFEQHGDASMIVAMFDNAYEQAVRLANNNSISVQRMATVENQIKEMEERLQDAISHQVAALREAALEQNVELNEALSNGEVTIDDIDLDIRSGLTPGSIGVSFYGTETEEGSEAQIYTELVNDLQERLKTLQQERQTIEEEQGVLAIMKKNFEYFLACLKELPDTNAGGMPLRVNGLDVQGTLLRDVDGNAIEGRKRAITSGKLKLTPERIAEAPDMLHFEKGIYCAFVESGVLQGDVATYKTNFGVTLTSKGNRRTLDSFMGYKRSDMDGNVVYVDAPYKVYGFSIQYRRYLTTAAKREREEAV